MENKNLLIENFKGLIESLLDQEDSCENVLAPIYVHHFVPGEGTDSNKLINMRYRCSIVKKEQWMSLHGVINTPDGGVDVDVQEYLLGVYFLRLEITDKRTGTNALINKEEEIGKAVDYLIGTNRVSVIRAHKMLMAAKPTDHHQVEYLLTDAGFPSTDEINASMKSPIKHNAKREHGVPGVLVNDRSTTVTEVTAIEKPTKKVSRP